MINTLNFSIISFQGYFESVYTMFGGAPWDLGYMVYV